jgi:radical SAM protein with 4Fe4S-binding SPASM domain
MFYRLSENYKLRGWEKATSVLIDSYNNYKEVAEREFSLLLLCDGEVDLDDLGLSQEDSAILDRFLQTGILECSREPFPMREEQKYLYHDNRFVRSVFWSITGKCNYKCRHCYLNAPDAALGELTTETALSLIDQMAECGVLQVDISGGEPLVRKDFWTLIEGLHDYGIRVGVLYTNGAVLNESILERFSELGMDPQISISFDGLGTHDWLRGVKGAEKAALRALELCRNHGFTTDVEMCIHNGNKHTLRDTVNFLKDYGVSALKTAPVTETELWRKHAEGNQISLREYFETVISYIPDFYKDGMPMDITLSAVASMQGGSTEYSIVPEALDPESGREECRNCYLCASARFNTYIAPDGRLLPCMPMAAYSEYSHFPKVQEIGLKRGLSDSYYMDFVSRRVCDLEERNTECASCPYLYRCGGGCRANALSIDEIEGHHSAIADEMGFESRLMGRDPYQCILFKEGYVDRIHETFRKSIELYCSQE